MATPHTTDAPRVDLFDQHPAPALTTRFLWEALIDVGPREDLGTGPLGERGLVPIIGGRFRGGPGMDLFRGVVLPGGADRQLLRLDGVMELDALFEMRVEDGTVLTVSNLVLIDDSRTGPRYALSQIKITAPKGPWDWLSRRILLGTVQNARPQRDALIIRGWVADAAHPDAPA